MSQTNAMLADRDLGSCLTNVRVLWMARCATSDLDGIASLTNLRELYLAYNDIVDISPCTLLEHIQTLDLEGFVCCMKSDMLHCLIIICSWPVCL